MVYKLESDRFPEPKEKSCSENGIENIKAKVSVAWTPL